MEALLRPENSGTIYQSTRSKIPEDLNLHQNCDETSSPQSMGVLLTNFLYIGSHLHVACVLKLHGILN
jgi:hypothetical protein